MSIEEGLERAAAFLTEAIITDPAAKPWWC
jgi:hypothetical protein